MKVTFEEAYFNYLKYVEIKQKKQSVRTLKERFNRIIVPYFKNYYVDEINEKIYIEFQRELLIKNYKYNYLRNIHYLIVAFFDYLIKFYDLKKNVARIVGNFENKNNDSSKNDFYTSYEFKKFIKKVDNNIYKQFFIFMFLVGTRPGETMALTFDDIDYNTVTINKTIDSRGKREISTPKTKNSIRKVAIDKKLYKNLMNLKNYYISKYDNFNNNFFVFGGIKPLSPTSINRVKKKASELAKVKCIRIHDFRHSHATLLIDNNVNLKVISERLGHSDPNTTLKTYIHITSKQEKRVISTLSKLRII